MTLLMNPMRMMGKIRIARYELKAVKSPRLMLPAITKWPPSARMTTVATLTASVIDGIRLAKRRRILSPRSLASVLAAMNFCVSICCVFSKTYQRSAENAFIDDAVQPVDGFLRLA